MINHRRFDINYLAHILTLVAALVMAFPAFADEPKKDPPKEPPKVGLANPLAALPGATTKITLRGWRLDTASEVKASDEKAQVKLLKQEKTGVPAKQDAKRVGDTHVEIELTLAADMPTGVLNLVVKTPDGESAPYELLIGGAHAVVAEKEPNDGFRQAQGVQLPQIVDGTIHAAANVDVFSFEGTAGQKIVCEVLAARRGSALDSQLTLYDAKGNFVASHDDLEGNRDSRLELTLPSAGRYYLVLQDAHDQGGPAHPYRLVLTSQ